MSVIVFAGAAQFAAVGYVASGLPWPGIILLTFLLNARHLLYSAALAPWLRDLPFARRAVMAHLLTDEAFALTHQPLPAARPDRRVGLLGRGDRGDVHPVEPRDDRRGRPRCADPGPGAARHRHHLPGRDDRPRGRAHHRPARARRGASSGRASRSRSRSSSSPSIGIVTGGVVGPLVGLLVPDVASPVRRRRSGRPVAPSATRCRAPMSTRTRWTEPPVGGPTDDDRPRPPVRPDVRGHLPDPGASAC